MARIAGINLQDDWRVAYALTKIKGIGWSLAQTILDDSKIDSAKRVADLTADEVAKIAKEVSQYHTEGELLREVRGNIQRLKTISSYRGMRHTRGLPTRGQRTKTNARTKRGARKTVGAFRKEQLSKLQQQKQKEKGAK